jgi:PKD repeat protein
MSILQNRICGILVFFILINFSFINIIKTSEHDPDYQNELIFSDVTSDEIHNVNEQLSHNLGNEAVTFENVSYSSNITSFRSDSFAWGDYNNDGYLDFITRGNTSVGTRLFKNSGPPDWKFTDVSNETNILGNQSNPNRGYPIWGDYNNDGDLDFFMAGDSDKLFKNLGFPNWTFEDVTIQAGDLNDNRPSEAAAWGDYDRDGYIDLYVNSWYSGSTYFHDVLWHNNGDGTFSDVSNSAGIYSINTPSYRSPPFAGMAVAWGDYNNDGWLDIYVGKYHVNPNFLFRNNHDGTFTDVASVQGVAGNAQSYGGFGPGYGHTAGAGWADFNNNGDLDLWISNLAHKDSENFGGQGRGYFCDDSMMFLNSGGPFFEFSEIRNRTGIPIIPVGTTQDSQWKDEDYFGVSWGDYDNDGDIDFWVPQVKTYHSWANSYLWRNNNDETFTDDSDNVGIKVWSNTGGVWGDYNNDGFLDMLTEGTYPYQGIRETRLFKNNGNSNNWLQLRLKGVISNSAAIGARVLLKNGAVTQLREIGGDAGGHAFQNSFNVEFGLGSNTKADVLKILWPSGIVQVLKNIDANQILNVTENTTGPRIKSTTVSKYQAFEDEALTFSASYTDPISQMQWDFDNDGIIDYECTGCYPPIQATFTKAGNYTAKVWVWDGANELGWTETTDIILVENVKPTADAGANQIAWEDQLVGFDAHFSTDTPSDIVLLEYNWSFGDGSYTGWTNLSNASYSYVDNALYEVVLKVRDDDHSIAVDSIWITVNNRKPSCSIDYNSTVPEDKKTMFKADCFDTISDLPDLLTRWDFGDGNNTYWSTEPYAEHTYTKSGTYNLRCIVRDDDWPDDENYTEVEVIVYNIDPECWLELDGDAVFDEDEQVDFYGIGNDTVSDNYDLMFMWDFGDGNITDWLQIGRQNTSHIYTRQGIYSAKLIVQDDDWANCTDIINITIKNVPPSCTAMVNKESEITVIEDDMVLFDGTGTDTSSDIDTIEYSWDMGLVGYGPTPWNSSAEFEFSYTKQGDYEAILTIRDDDGDTNSAIVQISVINLDPIPRFLASETSINEDNMVYFDASDSEDTPSDMLVLNYTWKFGDKSDDAYGVQQRHVYTDSGEYKVSLIVTDDDGGSDRLIQKIKVKNVKPKAVLNASGTEVNIGTEITFNGQDSWDTQSDYDSLQYSWDFDDPNIDVMTGPVVTQSFQKPGRYRVILTVTDDDSESGTAELEIKVNEIDKKDEDGDSDSTDNLNLLMAGLSYVILIIILLIIIFLYIKRKRKQPSTKDETIGSIGYIESNESKESKETQEMEGLDEVKVDEIEPKPMASSAVQTKDQSTTDQLQQTPEDSKPVEQAAGTELSVEGDPEEAEMDDLRSSKTVPSNIDEHKNFDEE